MSEQDPSGTAANPTTSTTTSTTTSSTQTTTTEQEGVPEDLRTRDTGKGPGDSFASAKAITAASIYQIALLLVLVYTLLTVWPQPTPSMGHSERERLLTRTTAPQQDSLARARQPVQADSPAAQPAAPAVNPPAGAPANPPANQRPPRDTASAAANTHGNERHQRMVMPGPGVAGVPGFYRCIPPDPGKVWVVHEDDILDPQCVKFAIIGSRPLSNEQRMALIVLLCGALGALLHGMRSLRWYVGTRWLKVSWVLQYYTFPFTGALLALGVYAALRGGFSSPATDVTQTNPINFAAAAFLVGLFSEEAIEKLREIAKAFFSQKQQGPESAPGEKQTPAGAASGAAGAGTAVGATGTDASAVPEEEGDAGLDDIEDPAVGAMTFGVSAVTLQDITGDHAPDQLQVRGIGFMASTQVEVDGVSRPPEFHDSTLLTLALTQAEVDKLAALASLEVIAVEPGPPTLRSQPVSVP